MNMIKSSGIQALFTCCLFFLVTQAQAQTGDPIGLILSTSGNVTAQAEDGTERRLRRRSPLYEGDTVITAVRSRAQIRFNDNGLVALQPETSFFVEEHTFNGQEDGSESAVYRLFRGGLQAITGLIGNTNKSRYRFETPLATIGLRGTHWAATYCSTACNGLAPGLYGGVVEGGIDVCNAGGCEAVDQDGYFYVEDQNTSPRALVRKPSVVLEDTTSGRDEEEEEEEEENSEEGSEDGDGGEGDGQDGDGQDSGSGDAGDGDDSGDAGQFGSSGSDAPDADTGLGAGDENLGQDFGADSDPITCSNDSSAANACNPDSDDESGTTFSITQLQSGEAQQKIEDEIQNPDADGDGVADVDDIFPQDPTEHADLDGDGQGDNSDPYPAFVTSEVAAGSAVALASGNSSMGALNATMLPDGSGVSVVLTEQGDVGNVYLDSVDTANCAPSCEVEVVAGELIESGGIDNFAGAGFGVNWGLWDLTQSGASINGSSFDVGPNLHYGYSPNAMTFAEYDAYVASLGMPMVAKYSMAGGTSPTNQSGALGTLNEVIMAFDFFYQTVTEFSINLDIGDLNYQAMLYEKQDLLTPIMLVGYVNGSSGDYTLWGDTSMVFIGNSAQGVLGSYSLRHIAGGFSAADSPNTFTSILPTNTANGVYVLEQDAFEPAPYYFSDAIMQSSTSSGGIAVAAALASIEGLDGQYRSQGFPTTVLPTIGDQIRLYEREGINALVGFDIVELEDGIDCDPCLQINEGYLVEFVSYSGASFTVDFGSWISNDVTASVSDFQFGGDSRDVLIEPELHFGYTEDQSLAIANLGMPLVANYSYVAGTAPTDELGNVGSVNNIDMGIDFYQQAIVSFDMQLAIGDRDYFGFIHPNNSTAYIFADEEDVELDLIGLCTGGTCGNGLTLDGETSFVFLGNNNEGALGSYALNTFGAYIEERDLGSLPFVSATGVYLLESEGNSNNPNFYDGSLSVVDPQPDSLLYGAFIDKNVNYGLVDALMSSYYGGSLNSFGLVNLNGAASVPTIFNYGEGDPVLTVNEGVLAEYGSHTFVSGAEANWGRWYATDVTYSYAPEWELNPLVHFGYTEDMQNAVAEISDKVITYRLAGGTAPTDQYGRTGFLEYVDMALNFYNQSIASFDLGLTIDEVEYLARLASHDYYLGEEIYFNLVGHCFGGECGNISPIYGRGSVSFVGADTVNGFAEGALGAYSLYGGMDYFCGECYPYTDARAQGVFALEQYNSTLVFSNPGVLNPTNAPDAAFVSHINSYIPIGAYISSGLNSQTLAPNGLTGSGTASINMLNALDYRGRNVDAVTGITGVFDGTPGTLGVLDGTLINYREETFADAQVTWGSWIGEVGTVDNQGVVDAGLPASDYFQFIYADNWTTALPTVLGNWNVRYGYAGGPAPMDMYANPGAVERMFMNVNYLTSQVMGFGTAFEIMGDYYEAYYNYADVGSGGEIVDLGDGTLGAMFPLGGQVNYGSYGLSGDATIAFAGSDAQVAVGALAVKDGGGYYSATQDFVLRRQALLEFDQTQLTQSLSASGVAALSATVLDLGSDYLAISGTNTSAVDIVNLADKDFSVDASGVTSGSFSGDSSIVGSAISFDVDLTEARLDQFNSVGHDDRNFEAYWGRWLSYDQVDTNEGVVDTVGAIHFAYSEDMISVADMQALESQNMYLSYGMSGQAHAVSDQSGGAGFLNYVDMSIDFGTQTIDSFYMDLNTSDGNWNVSASGVAIDAYSATQNFEVNGSLDSFSAQGNVNTAILGANADAVLGAYNLSAPDVSAEAAGTFLLEQQMYEY